VPDGPVEEDTALIVQDPLPRPHRLQFRDEHDQPPLAVLILQLAQVSDGRRAQRAAQ